MRHRPSKRKTRCMRRTALGTGLILLVAALNVPAVAGFAGERLHDYRVSRPEYQARYGSWEVVDVPEEYQTNAIHAVLLRTGKVLLIAGSGNEEDSFEAGTFESVLWDPEDDTFTAVATPEDLFCAGHAQLPDGRLLVAGGTARYEVLGDAVTHAGGPMRIKNENPDAGRTLPKGTRLRSPSGQEYVTEAAVTVPPATKETGAGGAVKITASEVRVFVTAGAGGQEGVARRPAQYRITGLRGREADNLYGLAGKITLGDQDFQGIDAAYEFDPEAERYVPVPAMDEARWYPTLTALPDGRVLTVSGLDEVGQVVPGHNEIYDPETRTWSDGPSRYFPTYPALFLTEGGKIFYTGSNAGYGPAGKGRDPGIWDLATNTFTRVGGLTDPGQLETSASLLLPPAQDQRFMVLGGGGVGESPKSTARTAIIDLREADPQYRDGPRLPQGTRYLSGVILPDDTVFTTGGSRDYRGQGRSDVLSAQFYDPVTDAFRPAADPTVGRTYHSGALLLPDGRVATFGGDPLFSDANDTTPGEFERRIEVYTPPSLHGDGERPVLGSGPATLERGGTATFGTRHPERIAEARLMRPSAVTHSTDVEQRSIQLAVARGAGEVTFSVPGDASLIPPGWYMLFVTDARGTPSEAVWVQVP